MNISISVAELESRFGLRRLSLEPDMERRIEGGYVAYAGLALAGWLDDVTAKRVVLLGDADIGFLSTLEPSLARERLRKIFERDISCLVLHARLRCPKMLVDEADRLHIPVLGSSLPRMALQPELLKFLRFALAPRKSVHGVMIDVCGVGTLVLGKSGIGKSECALELVKRGHRLVCDDVVLIKRIHDDKAVATAAGPVRYYMEIRGIGLIHIPSLFGVGAITDQKDVDLIVRLEEPDPERNYERLGIDQPLYNLLGVKIPLVEIPVIKGKNLSILVEAAAMNQHLRAMGINSAQIFSDELHKRLVTPPMPLLFQRPG